MLEYLLKFLILSLISYVAGRLLINYCFNYRVNRFWLLFCLCFSVVIPLVNFEIGTDTIITSINLEKSVVKNTLNAVAAPFANNDTTNIPIHFIIILGYSIITLLLLLRFSINIRSILKKRRNAIIADYMGANVYLLEENIKPFTFLEYIFFSKKDWLTHKNKAQLLEHEIYHRNLNHSFDILLIEIMKVIFWFNPVLYFYKILIQSNHEYQVDNAIISSGFDPQSYTHIIIDYTFKPKTKEYNLSSGFSLSLIKNRIHMISKFKKNRTSFKQSIIMASLMTLVFLSTAFTLKSTGYFLGDSMSYSQEEKKLYLKGDKIKVMFGDNNISGTGTFSFLGEIDYFKVNTKLILKDTVITITDRKCLINKIIDTKKLSKLGLDKSANAFEITIE